MLNADLQPFLALQEYNSKFVNICEMHGTEGPEAVVLLAFQQYVQFIRKSDENMV